MKRLGILCATVFAIAACSFALAGCGNTNGKTGPSEPDSGSTKAVEETEPSESFDKSTKTKSIPRVWAPNPKSSSLSTLKRMRTSTSPASARTRMATETPCWSLQ